MERVFGGMDVHEEKIVAVGLPNEGSVPVFREAYGGKDLLKEKTRSRCSSFRYWR